MSGPASWRTVSLLLGVLTLAVPLGMIAGGLALAAVDSDLDLGQIGDYVLLGFVVLFLAQLAHSYFAVRRLGRTSAEARIHRLRAIFLGPIGVFLNVRDMTRHSEGRATDSTR